MTAVQPDLFTGMTRAGDPETSHMAARSTDRAEGKRRVLAFLTMNYSRSFTDHEIAAATGLCTGSASKRRLDLQRDGLVEFAGEWGTTPTGSSARRWRLTRDGLEA